MASISQAIRSLRPMATFCLVDDDYENIEWFDESIEKPLYEDVVVELERLSAEEALVEYKKLRAAEYPPMSEYLDGIVKNDQDQINKYIADCLAVKEKYPKPDLSIGF